MPPTKENQAWKVTYTIRIWAKDRSEAFDHALQFLCGGDFSEKVIHEDYYAQLERDPSAP